MSQGLLVLVGVDAAPGQEPLTYAGSDATELRALLPADVAGEPLLDPTEEQARTHLKSLRGRLAEGGPLLLVWSGRGLVSAAGELRLLAVDSDPDPGSGLSAGDVAARCVGSGASQLL